MRSWRPPGEIHIEETKAPSAIAPYAFALSATIDHPCAPETEGRLILLHDPDGHDSWGGTLRLVTYVSVALDHVAMIDPIAAEMAWSWLLDGLDDGNATYTAAGGTVTSTFSVKFGELATRTDKQSGELASRTERRSSELASRTNQHSGELASRAGRHSHKLAGRFVSHQRVPFGRNGFERAGYDNDDCEAVIELRASWTPRGDNLTAQLDGWCAALAAAAGLPPVEAAEID